MKIRCNSNQGKDLNKCNLSDPPSGYNEKTIFKITPGKEYTVYGITMYHNSIWYYIAQDDYADDGNWITGVPYPSWEPAELFTVIDNRISATWVLGIEFGKNGEILPLLAFPEWAKDPYDYYDGLSDGAEKEVEIFVKYKKIMDEEFK